VVPEFPDMSLVSDGLEPLKTKYMGSIVAA
jgi:hypothetical protein